MNPAQKKAIRIAEKVFSNLKSILKPGLSEKDVAYKIKRLLKKYGAKKESFRMIIASGKRSAKIHGFASNKRIKKGEIVMLDFGALYKGYRSDITRTYVLGKPTKRQKRIYSILLKAQRNAIKKVKAGVPCEIVDSAARSIIKNAGYGKNFKHSIGHAIGRKTHEAPKISPKNRGLLKAGMVITIEPGIYIKGWGGMRIEDMLLVTKKGCKLLTKVKRSLHL